MYPAIPGHDLDESYDAKGIKISRGSISHPDATVLLSWAKVEKRIGQLIAADRYLNQAEKDRYPAYRAAEKVREARWAVAEEFRSIVYDYNDLVAQLDEDKKLNLYYLSSCWTAFGIGDKKMFARTSEGDYILPMMREAMNTIIADNTPLTARCEAMLATLGSDIAKPLEPTYDELNPPPESAKEYQVHVGDTVYVGAQEYAIQSVNGDEVSMFDPSFPIMVKTVSYDQLRSRLAENPLNEHLLVEVPDAPVEEAETSVPQNDAFIDHYYVIPDLEVTGSLDVQTFSIFEEAYAAYAALPSDKVKALGVQNSNSLPGSLDFIQCRGGVDTIIEDYTKVAGWDNPEISALLEQISAALPSIDTREEPTEKEDPEPLSSETLPTPPPRKAPRVKNSPALLHPEIPSALRHNFRIEDDQIGVGTASQRFQNNVAAIRTLKKVEAENRLATPEEQEILSRYVGWGGLADCFDDRHSRYQELRSLLDDGEYIAARASTLSAFYTPPVVIKGIYEALGNMGFRTGNILEPSCGVGNFMGLLPDAMQESKMYGIELDPISGRIAQQLYQKNGIAVQGFESTELPDSFFDVIIGNVPFGSFKVPDRRYDKHNFLIHDYFFAKALDKVRPGGVVAFVTSKGTMDKLNPNVRRYLAQRADLLGAIRLPNNTFKAAAGTDVTSDIIFLQRRERMSTVEPEWVHVGKNIPDDAPAQVGDKITWDGSNYAGQPRGSITAEVTEVCTGYAGNIYYKAKDEERSYSYISPVSVTRVDRKEFTFEINQYFLDHPEMVLGEVREVSGPFGPEAACFPTEGADLGQQLHDAIQNIHAEIPEADVSEPEQSQDAAEVIPADPSVRNYSFTDVDGQLYYRENSIMKPISVSAAAEDRIRGLIGLRDTLRQLIEYQTEDWPESDIQAKQRELGDLYDTFTKKNGLINSRANNAAFGEDSSFFLLCSLEMLDDNRQFVRKADIFSKRTIRKHVAVTSVDTASEALALSLSEKAKVDMAYMVQLTGKTEEQIVSDLEGVIFRNPLYTGEESTIPKYLPADEYLSGNVREKLAVARQCADLQPEFAANVAALETVQPTDLDASEISVRLGATWIPPEIVEQFMFELFDTPFYMQRLTNVHFSEFTGEWNIEGKSNDRGNVKASSTYGTGRINGYKIIEDTLNLRDVRIFDYVEDASGNRKPVLNKEETAIAQGKQQLIKDAFAEWIWKDPQRRQQLCKLYNERFNSIRPREYDGSHLTFVGMNPEIQLRPHQTKAIAHMIYGGNTLLAHVVGAGKTYEMVAAAQESKRLGLCQKSLIVVPNHLTEQWASEYLQLYPSANILVATKKDFETKNRKRFCGKIATGEYDAVIIGHSQLEKIPISIERQREILEQQKDEILDGIAELKANRGERFTIKQLERSKKSIEAKLAKLNDQSRKDDVVTFEELGVDRLFIDEAHYYKNLAAFSKMRNVAGISQTEAQKSSDLYMKCRYLDEITGGKGVVFATGTPISNSMVEMYTMQKYLQYGLLKQNHLLNFDSWASTFGETVTAIELAPEGTGYRSKTRFAKFYNLPELMAMFKETADIQTADMLQLPVPEAKYHNVVLAPSDIQREMVESLSERAERVRSRMVDSSQDNMLVITNDGRKLALDQRLLNPQLPGDDAGKVAACADNVYTIWQQSSEQRSTQMVFCDLSTPHGDGKFNVYDDLRDRLIAKGIPAEEIAYIHTADTEVKKKELFGKVRSGQIRVLIGSTQKMGAGTNVQDKLIALHHLDCPWRPSDLQQREGRIIRQGNQNPEVGIYTYVTENTFDSYLYQLVESKQRFIGQIMTSKSPVRSAEDIDEVALSYAEIKALCAGNPAIKEKMDLDIEVSRLKLQKANHLSQRYSLEDQISTELPGKISRLQQRIAGCTADIERRENHTKENADGFSPMEINGVTYRQKKDAGAAILNACKSMTNPDPVEIGSYRGFALIMSFDTLSRSFYMSLKGDLSWSVKLGDDVYGNIQRLDNALANLEWERHDAQRRQENAEKQLANAKIEVTKPFPREEELAAKSARLAELNAMLDLDKPENAIASDEPLPDELPQPGSISMKERFEAAIHAAARQNNPAVEHRHNKQER